MNIKRYWAVVLATNEKAATSMIDVATMRGVRKKVVCIGLRSTGWSIGASYSYDRFYGIGFDNSDDLMKFKMHSHPKLQEVFMGKHTSAELSGLWTELTELRMTKTRHETALNAVELGGNTTAMPVMVLPDFVEAFKDGINAAIDRIKADIDAKVRELNGKG